MFKEFRISLIVGAFLAVANGVRIFIQYHNPGLAVVIACSLMGTVIMAKLVGCILPLLAKKVNLDPAIMASPLITTGQQSKQGGTARMNELVPYSM
jgi:magnesium transporter